MGAAATATERTRAGPRLARALAFALALAAAGAAGQEPPVPPLKPDRAASTAAPLAGPPLPAAKPPLGQSLFSRLLREDDIVRYRAIFDAQAVADWSTADRSIRRLDNPILMGHVLYQRYMHPTGWRSSFEQLAGWLRRYGDHPGARRVHTLANKRRPGGAAAPPRPQRGALAQLGDIHRTLHPAPERADPAQWSHLSSADRAALRELLEHVDRHVDRGEYAKARLHIEEESFSDLADPATRDRAAAEIARGLFIAGHDADARALAAPALERGCAEAPLACWIAGLAAYRQDAPAEALRAFDLLASGGPGGRRAAGAFWAARLSMLTGRPGLAPDYLRAAAAAEPLRFYGLLARRALGEEIALDERLPTLSDRERLMLIGLPEVRRAIALAQVGQQRRADLEFAGLYARSRPGLAVAVMRLAADLGLPATQLRLARELRDGFNERFDAALYPLPDWRPPDGFDIDPALLFAVMRQESGFRSSSRSGAGARGPMQIMPGTAAWIGGDRRYRNAWRHLLNEPEVALDLGQDYLGHLLDLDAVQGSLFHALTAWNAGPARMKRWVERTAAGDDPLLFIETVPARETRGFIEAAMENYWIYRLRRGASTPTLDMAAAGAWPVYADGEESLAGN